LEQPELQCLIEGGTVVTEAQKIAAGLTEAQRMAVAGGRWNIDPICADLMVLAVVERAPTVSWPYYARLTPLGLEVRKVLQS
jgi:hypothetical protein